MTQTVIRTLLGGTIVGARIAAAATLLAPLIISTALASDAECAPDVADPNDTIVDNSAQLPFLPEPECLRKGKIAKSWSSTEQWAWEQICEQRAINFDQKYCPAREHADLKSLSSDSRRQISGAFVTQILEDNAYASEIRSRSVEFVGALIDHISIKDAQIGSFRLSRSKVEGGVLLTNLDVDHAIILSQSEIVGQLYLRNIKGGTIAISQTKLNRALAEQLDITRLGVTGTNAQNFNVVDSTLSAQLSLSMGEVGDIWLTGTNSDGIYVSVKKIMKSLRLFDYDNRGTLTLDVESWGNDSSLFLRNVTARTFRLLRRSELQNKVDIRVPKVTTFIGFSFIDADWGDNPLPYLTAIMKASKDYNPSIYASLARSYAAAGRTDLSRDILIAQNDAERQNASTPWPRKLYLWFAAYLVAYGYRPEIGLAWVCGFALVSTLVFRSGSAKVIRGKQPRSWLIFALDAVIPGISLDESNNKISFAGWRQWFLYFLRFLAAVVVVLIISFIKNVIVGAL